ncbi:type II toxin-antitoxin system HicB family antitoxin [Glutamicibacter sp. 287]|uniref:type II toxin-antitoxin system HicB family antitoxin n=1 Tax=unclassified Glutamicibacter TaxID=2627139 RepID=UPI000BB88B3F|nr:hypothetical protein [Glutamicibacter sp. BW80]PCC29509.1 hypothetical protein CIK76_05850 [Glutamicibacter sp. BW80]
MEIEVRYVHADDVYAVSVPEVEGALTQAKTWEEVPHMARSVVADLTGVDIASVTVASVIEMDDGD